MHVVCRSHHDAKTTPEFIHHWLRTAKHPCNICFHLTHTLTPSQTESWRFSNLAWRFFYYVRLSFARYRWSLSVLFSISLFKIRRHQLWNNLHRKIDSAESVIYFNSFILPDWFEFEFVFYCLHSVLPVLKCFQFPSKCLFCCCFFFFLKQISFWMT